MIRTSPIARTGTLTRSTALRTTLRERKCSNCGDKFKQARMGQQVCSAPCGASYARRLREQQERKQTRERKAAIKTRGQHIADVQVVFNALVRYRDRNEQCISCQVHLPTLADQPGGGYDCGHYRSRGSAPHLRFDLRNAHGQCKKCNRYRAGNAADYRIGLIARIGLARVEALEADNTPAKWTHDDLRRMTKEFRAMLRDMKTETA